MALPGIRTVLKDRFYTLQRTDTAVGPRVVAIGYRDTAENTSDGVTAVESYTPYFARDEQKVIAAFGLGSHLHRAFLELSSGGAPHIYLVPIPADITDDDLLLTGSNAAHLDSNPFDLAFDAAEVILPDIIVPFGRGSNTSDWDDTATPGQDKLGFVADNASGATTSLAKRVADKMQVIADRSNPAFAIMGVSPFQGGSATDGSMTSSHTATHLGFPNLYNHNLEGNINGAYLTVVAAEVRPVGYPLSFGWANGAATYAGQVAQLNGWLSTTGRSVINVSNLRYVPNRTQQEVMLGKGVIPITLDNTRAAQWVDGRTFARDTSDYVRLSTLRIVFDVVGMIRFRGKPFIGMPASLETQNALDTAISSGLREFQQRGALLGSDYIITYIPRENKAVIDLVLQPAFEIRNIDIQVSLQL